MENELSYFTTIIICDQQIKQDFVSCLNQFVICGPIGKDKAKEELIKMKLAKYPLTKNMASFLQKEKFFYLLYNFTKSHLSIEYLFQELSKARRTLLDMVYSINDFLEYRYSEYPSPNSNAILGFCEKIDKLNSPFKQKSAIHKKISQKLNHLLVNYMHLLIKKKKKRKEISKSRMMFLLHCQ